MGGFAPNTENTSYIPQEVRETRRIILDANNARQTDAALPTTADMSSPQTYEAGVTRQPAESTSRALSNGRSTITKTMGTDTGNLRHRVPSLPTPLHLEVPLFDRSYHSTLTTATPGEWTGPKTISTPPLTHYLCATTVAHYFLPHPGCETTGFPGQSTSLAPSSQSQSSFPGVKPRIKMTERGRPYDIGHHFRSKASAARVQRARVRHASDENCRAASFPRPGEDSLEYAQGLALSVLSCSPRTGGEFGCISVIC